MNKNYKHIIWDWNGTLVNDSVLSRQCINILLDEYGMPKVSDEMHQELFDFPILNYYQKLGFDVNSEKLINEINTKFSNYYKTHRFDNFFLHNGAKDLLELIKNEGLSQSILSAHNQALLLNEIKHHDLDAYFDIVMGRNDITAGCKKELGQKKLQSLMHINPKDIIYIGDTTHDFEVAQDMGVNCILLDHGYQARKRLEQCNVPVLNSLASVESLILKAELV